MAPAKKTKSTVKPLSREQKPAYGTLVAPKAPKGGWENPLIPNARLQQIYAGMLRAKLLEAKLVPASRKTQRAPEAVASALLMDLRAEDTLATSAPSHPFLKGVPLKQLLAKDRTRVADSGFPAQHVLPTANSTAAINTAMDLARAYQLSSKGTRNSHVVLVFTTDAVACLRAARLAEKQRLPILFAFLQDDAKAALSIKARRYGIPGMPVDRDDAVAVYRVAQEAIARARSGGGPTLVECMRYVFPQQRNQSAIATMERLLQRKGLFTARWKRSLIADLRRQLAAARKKTKR